MVAVCVGQKLFTIQSMNNEETLTGAAADAFSLPSIPALSQAMVSRPPLPQVKPPPPLNLVDCLAKKWKLWKQTRLNFTILSNISSEDAQYQKALFLCTIGEGALEIFKAFQYAEGEDPNNVDMIISKFQGYFTGMTNKTHEHFKFNQRNQEDGEAFDAYLTAHQNLAETCNFCNCPVMGNSLL